MCTSSSRYYHHDVLGTDMLPQKEPAFFNFLIHKGWILLQKITKSFAKFETSATIVTFFREKQNETFTKMRKQKRSFFYTTRKCFLL